VSIHWRCECGKSLKAPENAAGKRARCPACGKVNQVPQPQAVEEVIAAPAPAADFDPYDIADEPPPPAARAPAMRRVAPASQSEAMTPPPYHRAVAAAGGAEDDGDETSLSENRSGRTWRDFTYLVLLLAMVPLIYSTFKPNGSFVEILAQNVKAHPEVGSKLLPVLEAETAGLDEIVNLFPHRKFDGALLARNSAMHWVFAIMAAGLFVTLLMFLFDRGTAPPRSLLLTALFTGTVGIILLLGFQFVAEWTQNWWVRGRSIIVLLFYVVKFIGYSYYAADNPSNGFAASFFGYTFGVGLCEELCKALPLIVFINNVPERATWRTACLWGLASGIGFGIAEGIIYSGRSYNGIVGGDVYLLRFLSCVALHAVWSAAVAITLYKFRHKIAENEGWFAMLGTIIVLSLPCMIFHGLYDTLLKKQYEVTALITALVSFVYLALLIEWNQRVGEPSDREPQAGYVLPGRHMVR
jgi:RsiW-degrading membrane proteinase PrsW (M82 family)